MFKKENEQLIEHFQAEVDKRWDVGNKGMGTHLLSG